MVSVAESTLRDVDVILWLVEASDYIGAGEQHIAECLRKVDTPVILVINKIDKVKKEEILGFIDAYKDICDFAEIIPLSALKGENTENLIPLIFKYMEDGPQYYDEDTVTDQPERQIAAELIREKALRKLDDEIPHDFVSIYRAHPKSQIISLHPSAFLSGSYNAAYQAAISIDPEQKRIKVINSNSISVGLGCLVTEAADFIAANPQANLDEVNTYIKSLTGKIHLLFTVPSLQYLIRGGRLRTPKQKLERLSQAYHIFSYSGENSIAPLARSQNLNKALCDMAQRVKAEDERYKIGKIFIVCSPSLKTVKNANALDTSQAIIPLDRELSKLNLPAPIIRTEPTSSGNTASRFCQNSLALS